MTPTTVIVPVKSTGVKSRLSAALSGAQRVEFSRLLLRGVLAVLRQEKLIGHSLVVSPEPGILALASKAGAVAVAEPEDSGVNSAVKLGMSRVSREDDVLVLPSDLPLLRGEEVEHLLAMKAAGLGLVIAPSASFDGTNALLLSMSSPLPLSYDADSFWTHLGAAARLGLSVGVCTRRGLLFDVDTPDDLRTLARMRFAGRPGAYARRVLG